MKIIYGKAGTGKSTYCFNEISKLIKENKKVYIITPEQFSFNAEKKLMETIGRKAVINAEVISFNRMAHRVMVKIGENKKTKLSNCGKMMLISHILNSKKSEFKFLGKSEDTIDIIQNAISEFKKHGILVETLKEEVEKVENKYLKTKISDMAKIYEIYENQLQDKYIDETDILTILAENIDQVDSFKDSYIFIDEFQGFTYQEYTVIEKLFKISEEVTITSCIDNLDLYTNPDTDIFYSNKITVGKLLKLAKDNQEKVEEIYLEKTKRFKTEDLVHLEENIFEIKVKKYDKEPENIKLFLAKNQYMEIEEVAKNIVKQIRSGYRYRDISIITKNIDTYSNLIRAIFDKYDIPVFIDEQRELSQNIIIQYVLSIFEIYNRNFSYEEVFNYLKTGFSDIDIDDIFKLENYSLKWGIKQSKWKKDFEYYDKEKDEEFERLNELRKIVINPLLKLKNQIDENKTAIGISKSLYEFLIEQKIEEKVSKKVSFLEENGLIDLANEYRNSLKVLTGVLDEIVLVFGNDKISIDKYLKILKIGLKNSGLNKIPGTQDQVTVGDVERSRTHKVDIVYIIGINDGAFPSVNNDEGFLNDEDREKLKNDGIELAKGTIDRLYEDNFNTYKAFTTSEEKLFLSYSSANNDGKALRGSVLINKIKKIFPLLKEESNVIEIKREPITVKTTYEDLINSIADLNQGNEISDIWYKIYKYYLNNVEYQEKLEYDLKGLKFDISSEKIDEVNINKLYGNIMQTSISKLERYRSCPFSYFLQYGLNVKEKEELKIQSFNTGTFMHEVIDEFFEYLMENGISVNDIDDLKLENIIEKIINEKLKLTKNYIFVSNAKCRVLILRLKRVIIKSMIYILESLRQSKFEVFGTEIEFGKKGKYKPIILDLENGKKVEITGKIDRIDIGKDNSGRYLRIIDYKSSAKNIELDEVYAGLQLQLLTYLDAACKIEDLMPAGILYFGLLEQMIKANKNMTEEEIEAKIKANFKMKGLILADVNVIKMHDKNLEDGKDSKIIQANLDKDGNVGAKTKCVTKYQFEDLQKYINKTLKQISKEILSGKIDIKPAYRVNKPTPCSYCSYNPICGFNSGICKRKYNYIEKLTKEEVLNLIKEK